MVAAVAAGLSREEGEEQLTDELIGQVVSGVRPVRPDGHGGGWAELEARREEITALVKAGVPVVKIGILLGRHEVVAAERTLHRFAAERCGAGGSKVTTPVDDGPRVRSETVAGAWPGETRPRGVTPGVPSGPAVRKVCRGKCGGCAAARRCGAVDGLSP